MRRFPFWRHCTIREHFYLEEALKQKAYGTLYKAEEKYTPLVLSFVTQLFNIDIRNNLMLGTPVLTTSIVLYMYIV